MARKQGRQGSIYYDKSRKKWRAQIYERNYQTGKYTKKTRSFDTESEARQYVDAIMYQSSNSIYIKNNGIPLSQLMRANIQRKLDTNLISENQYGRVLKTIKLIEKSTISNKKIDEITGDEIQDYLNSIKHYSNSYIKKIYEQFNQSFKYAINRSYIYKNPMNDVVRPKSKKKDKIVRALTVEEQQEFTEYLININPLEYTYKNVFLVQMYMGLRVGEVLALKSTDIDLQHNIIKIDKTLTTDINGKVVVGFSTKTSAGNRELPIPEYLRPHIMEQMSISKDNENKQLFLSKNGNLVDNRNVNRMLKKTLKELLNITDISTHSLRHTYGTRCIEAGMSAVALQRLMGHNDVSVTLNTYTSVFNRYKEAELEKVNNYYLTNNLMPSQNTLSIQNGIRIN